jgi:hypothetical protein
MKPRALGLATSLVLCLSGIVLAQDLAAEPKFTETGLGFELKGDVTNVTLTVAGPNRFHASVSARRGAPEIDLRRFGPIEDGTYTYQLTGATNETEKVRTKLDDGRTGSAEPRKSVATSGAFQVRGGVIVKQVPGSGKRDGQ